MSPRHYTIGEVARLSGVPVRRLRFYADEGLLPTRRTENGYRAFSEADLVRLTLICTLREAGLGLEKIRDVISTRTSIAEVLMRRLAEIDAQVSTLSEVAAVIRASLHTHDLSEKTLRRIWTMTTLSQAERGAVIRRFFDKVAEGTNLHPRKKEALEKMSTPDLPDNPTREQVDA